MIFSGSAVFDAKNSSGLGRPDAPPWVALHTVDVTVTEEDRRTCKVAKRPADGAWPKSGAILLVF